MRRNGLVLLEFEADKGPYRAGHRSWVPESKAEEYSEVAFEYKPDPEPEPEAAPNIDLPKELPGRNHFIEAEIYSFDRVKDMASEGSLKEVPGIGESTEIKINNFLD